MRRFLLVGLTGSIATGKSTVSEMFRRLGGVIIDADLLAREVVEPGEPALAQIAAEFGPEVLQPDGTIDRKKLGAVVFADPARRKRLEEITHPAIRDRFLARLAELEAQGFAGIVLWDAPVMIESGGYKNMDRLVVVATDEATQAARLRARDGIDTAEAERKIRSQMSIAEKAKLADYVIDNAGDRVATEARVSGVHAALTAELAVASCALNRAAPLAALFPVDMGHYRSHRFPPSDVFQKLAAGSKVSFVAYHSNVSGNFLFQEPRQGVLDDVRCDGEALVGLPCVVRTFPELIRVHNALPGGSRVVRRSIVLRADGKDLKVVVVFLSDDVPSIAMKVGRVGDRVRVRHWVSSRDVLCLYDRQPEGGSVGQVRMAILRAVKRSVPGITVNATSRAMSVVKDIVSGRLNFPLRSAVHGKA